MTIRFRWVTTEGQHIPIPYNLHRRIIHTEIMDYAIHLERLDNLSHQYIKNELFHLSLFENFLRQQSIDLIDATNTAIRAFRDHDYERLLSKGLSSSKSVKSVVNLRLRRIYHFFTWFQLYSKKKFIIGRRNCQIHSSLPEYFINKNNSINDRDLYPLCFRRIGGASKHTTKYEATEQDKDALEWSFLQNSNEYIGQRNSLILEIADLTGFRRSSINSLLCSQFSDQTINSTNEDFILISPPHQKYGYTLTFKFPILLALRVNGFINSFRRSLIEKLGTDPLKTEDRIFLSARNGLPLNNQTISEIFHDAISSINIPQSRVGIHSFRRKFANDRISDEILTRAELGLDSSTASVELSISLQLGQTSSSSIRPYVSRRQILEIEKARAMRAHDLEALRIENANLRKEILELKANMLAYDQESRKE